MIDSTIENPCYDTVGIFYPFNSEEEFMNELNRISPLLEQSELKRKNHTGAIILTGKIRNIKAVVTRSGVSIIGSLCVYHKGNNYLSMTRKEVMLCILSLQVLLGLPLQNAIVRRLDFGCCLKMNERPEIYFSSLGSCGKYERWSREYSQYYETKYKTLIFYNKTIEMTSRNFTGLPEQIHNNTLRFELRMRRQLAYQLNREVVLVKDLYDEQFYKEMIDRWMNEYERINKNKLLSPIKNNLSCNDGIDYTLSSLIELHGTNNLTKIIERLKYKFTRGAFARYQKKLKSLKFLSKESELITELNTKILLIKENALFIASNEG